jgi:hypothetical protein
MAMEIDAIIVPDNCIFVFDELCKAKEHDKGFYVALRKFLNCVEILTEKNAEIIIPAHFINKGEGDIWINIQELLENVESFSHSLYFLKDFEFTVEMKCSNKSYTMFFCSDPIYFNFKEIDKPKSKRKWWQFW